MIFDLYFVKKETLKIACTFRNILCKCSINITDEVFHMLQLMRLSGQCHAAFIFLWLCSVYVHLVRVHRHDLSAFKESVHGLVCCAASGINLTEIGAYFYYGLHAISLILLRLVCNIPSSSIMLDMVFILILRCLTLLM